MTNKMAEVAKLLGVELEEEFKIKNHWGENLVKITAEKGLMCWGEYSERWTEVGTNGLNDILLGKYEIEKLPWKPKCLEKFYHIELNGHERPCVILDHWMDNTEDNCFYKLNLVYSAATDCEVNLKQDYEKLTGEKWKW